MSPNFSHRPSQQIDENIGNYPEWMQGGDEFCALGPQATACVLRWTWRVCEGHAAKGREFLQRIYGLEQECSRVGLDGDQCFKFFVALAGRVSPGNSRRSWRRGIHRGPADTRSVWHRIHHHLEQAFDPSAYLESSEAHLPEDWHYGEALIADALANEDYEDAEHWIQRTFASFLRRTDDEVWLPEDSLLPAAGHHYYGLGTQDDVAEVIGTMGDVSR